MNNGKRKTVIIIMAILAALALAVAIFFVFAKGRNGNLKKHLNLGQKYLEDMKYEDAIAEFNKALEIDPMCEEAYIGLADAYIGTGDYQAAYDILNQGIDNGVIGLDEKLAEVTNLINGNSDDDVSSGGGDLSGEDSQNTDSEESLIQNGQIKCRIEINKLLKMAEIDGRHISEWTVDELIAFHGLVYNGTNYQSVNGGRDYQVASIENGCSTFSWHFIGEDEASSLSYEYSETINDVTGYIYYDFGFFADGNMPSDSGIFGYAVDNGMTDADGFLTALGLSDEVMAEMRKTPGTEYLVYDVDGTNWQISVDNNGSDGGDAVTLWTSGIRVLFNHDYARKIWISYGPGKDGWDAIR